MTHLTFDEWACRNTQAKLDAYIDDELLVETNLEIAHHFERCPDCAREAAARRELRARVKVAVRMTPLSDGLESRLRDRVRRSGRERSMPWSVMSIAAAVVLCVASWFTYQRSMLRIAMGDHLHCAVIRQGLLEPVGQDKLTGPYRPVVAIAREQVPSEMYLTVAHECTFEGRKFVHVTFKDKHRLLSVIVTRRGEWERLPAGLHAMRIKGFQTAGFEAGEYLVYTVSDLSRRENLRILSSMAQALRNALRSGHPA